MNNSESLKAGVFLLATDLLQGSYFAQKVIFLAEHNPTGAYGLVINNRVTMPVNEVFSGIDRKLWRPHPFFLGGPVQEDLVQIVQHSIFPVEHASEVFPEVYMGGKWNDSNEYLEQLFSSNSTYIFLGYSGWGPGQLDREVDQNCWDILDIAPHFVLAQGHRNFTLPASVFKARYSSSGFGF